MNDKKNNILTVKNITKYFLRRRGIFLKQVGRVKAVDGVSFTIEKGKTYGLVGESGSGKSTLARMILKLVQPNAGKIIFGNSDITNLNPQDFSIFRKKIQIVLQDPVNSLDPRYKVKDILRESIIVLNSQGKLKRKLDKKIDTLLNMVNLDIRFKDSYPHQLSGGQAQRVCIARALCGDPSLIIWDEVTSGLDITTAVKILKLLTNIQNELNISYLFISHDLKMVKKISHIIGVMLKGKIIEESYPDKLFTNPTQKYTQKLLKASLFK